MDNRSRTSARGVTVGVTRDLRDSDYAHLMEDVTVPKLRDRLDELLDRVEAGETIRLTRDGRSVAEMRPVPQGRVTADIVEMMKDLPPLDYESLRRDIDSVIDPREP